jgi:hypothetical protein
MWMDQTTYGLQVSDKYITTAEVLALNATAIDVVPAPGAGKYLMFMGAVVFLDYASIAYVDDAGDDLVFKYTDKNGASISHTLDGSLFDGEADAIVYAYPLNAAASVLESAANAPICVCLENGEWITGNSPLKIRTFYRVITKADLELISA